MSSASTYMKSIAVFQGDQGKYYIINGKKYDIRFPLSFALDQQNVFKRTCESRGVLCHTLHELVIISGPEKCMNCDYYGSKNGVFVSYCIDCACAYDGTRGCPVDFKSEDTTETEMWESLPYMKGVLFTEIGDTSIVDEDESHQVHEDDEYHPVVYEDDEYHPVVYDDEDDSQSYDASEEEDHEDD